MPQAGWTASLVTKTDGFLLFAVLLFLASLFVWLTFLSPRPYTTVEGDIENDYFYNSLTESEGYAAPGSEHPGRPARLAYRFLFSVFGTDTGPRLQVALNWAYGGVFVLSAGAAVWFYLSSRRIAAPLIALLALMTALTTPPALAYYNHFGSESFVMPFGLILVGLGWRHLSGDLAPTLGTMAGMGALSGLCLSTKLSFVPLVIALGLALSLAVAIPRASVVGKAGRFRARTRRAVVAITCFWGTLVLVHVMMCIPLGLDLASLWRHSLTRGDVFPGAGSFLGQAFNSALLLARVDPCLVFISIWAVGVLAKRAVLRDVPRWRNARSVVWESAPRVLFLVAALAGLVYTLAVSSLMVGMFRDAGFDLRHAGPSFLAFPMLVLVAWGQPEVEASSERAPSRWPLVAIVALVCSSTAIHVLRREQFLQDYARYSAAARARFAELKEPGTRVAYWEKNAGEVLGEATWRFFGNYRWYRQESHDDGTLARFPDLTFFPLRSLGGYNPDRSVRTRAGQSAPTKRAFPMNLVRALAHSTLGFWFPQRDTSSYGMTEGRPELFVGERRGTKVSVVAYTVDQEQRELRMPRAKLLEILERYLGPVRCWEEDLGGRRWVIIKVMGSTTVPSY